MTESLDLDAIRARYDTCRAAASADSDIDEALDCVDDVPALLAEVARLREHSITLNRIGFGMATALGRVPEGVEAVRGDLDGQLAALVRSRDVWRDCTNEWEDKAVMAAATVERVRAVAQVWVDMGIGGRGRFEAADSLISFGREILDALSAADAPTVDAGTSEAARIVDLSQVSAYVWTDASGEQRCLRPDEVDIVIAGHRLDSASALRLIANAVGRSWPR